MSNATVLLARRSIRARLGRLIAIAVAIVLAVSFVVATFVLADSLRSGFKSLFDDLTEDVDLQARTSVAFGDVFEASDRDPVAADVGATIEAVPGVARVIPTIDRTVQLLDSDGDILSKGGAPTFLISWDPGADGEAVRVLEGAAPTGTEVVVDKATADSEDVGVGDQVVYLTDTGRHEATVSGLIGSKNTDGFGGASIISTEFDNAAAVAAAEGVVDYFDIQVDDGADLTAIQAELEDVLPTGVEVVDRQTLRDEANETVNTFIGPLSTGLLIFAFITAFISAFLINNVFAITIGQRLRELALLRAVGGAGRQVRRLIVAEALIMSVVATIIGVGGGLLVARLMLRIFNSAGAGFPDMPLVLKPTAVVMAFLVGVGITLLAVIVPARRAAKIPPVAAMRPELGFASLSKGRLVLGTATLIVGAVAFLVGIFVRPGDTPGIVAFAGGGALLIFVGAASVAATIAKPATTLIGTPAAAMLGAAGKLAQGNAGRAPRRTAATVSALMIGVALISAASVFASSLTSSFRKVLNEGVVADLVVVSENATVGGSLPLAVVDELREQPDVAATSGIQFAPAQINGENKGVGGADGADLGQLINLGVVDGDIADLGDGIAVSTDVVDDFDPELELGSTIDVTFQNGREVQLPVVAIYEQTELAGSWIVDNSLLDEVITGQKSTFFVPVRLADGTDPETAATQLEEALSTDFPQAKVQTAEQFRDDQAAQINQLLVIISVLLGLSIIIAVLGISITLGLAVFERTREIGLMRAVGMTKRQTRRMVRWEAIIVSTFGAIIGIVLGTLIGVALTVALPDDFVSEVSFNYSLVLVILIGAVIAGVIAALYPSAKASRLDVLQAIASE